MLDTCYVCGTALVEKTAETDLRFGHRMERIAEEFFYCETCHEKYYDAVQLEAKEQRAIQAALAAGSMLPFEFRRIRKKIGYSQVQMEKLLHIGPKTYCRWEKGTKVPNTPTCLLLRGIESQPGFLEYLLQAQPSYLSDIMGVKDERHAYVARMGEWHLAGTVTHTVSLDESSCVSESSLAAPQFDSSKSFEVKIPEYTSVQDGQDVSDVYSDELAAA